MNSTQNLKKELTERLILDGADLVRCGNAARFHDPAVKKLLPNAKTVIGIAFRQLRGSRRGIEDGTTYYQYTTTAVETIEETIIPMALLRASALLESAGFEALPQRRNQTVISDPGDHTNPEVDYHEIYHGKLPETQLDFNQCAVDAGLGEIGDSGALLTEQFGPFQRIAFILTDAELEPDPIQIPHLCDQCGECIRACPGHAITSPRNINSWQCAVYYNGANRAKNPFMPPDAFTDDPERLAIIAGEANLTPDHARKILDEIFFYPPIKHAYRSSICGRACDTACYIHLEEKGVLSKKFNSPFRKRPEWRLSVED